LSTCFSPIKKINYSAGTLSKKAKYQHADYQPNLFVLYGIARCTPTQNNCYFFTFTFLLLPFTFGFAMRSHPGQYHGQAALAKLFSCRHVFLLLKINYSKGDFFRKQRFSSK
jgi:hypothetical protein